MTRLSVSVVIPTLRRPDELSRCLRGLLRQRIAPNEVLVVHRSDDHVTSEVLDRFSSDNLIRSVTTLGVGQIGAIADGARSAVGEVVALLDDDSVPEANWLERLVVHYSDPTVGAVGGRDVVYHHGVEEVGEGTRVGLVTWCGRVIGNHHLGVGEPREVQVLKGVNSSFRRSLLRAPMGLRGSGAQVHNDMAMSLDVWHRGWKVVYDPECIVRHYPAARFGDDARGAPSDAAIQDAAYNRALCVGTFFPSRRPVFMAVGLLVGDRAVPGLLRAAFARAIGDRVTSARFVPAMRGQISGWRDSFRQGLHMEATAEAHHIGAI